MSEIMSNEQLTALFLDLHKEVEALKELVKYSVNRQPIEPGERRTGSNGGRPAAPAMTWEQIKADIVKTVKNHFATAQCPMPHRTIGLKYQRHVTSEELHRMTDELNDNKAEEYVVKLRTKRGGYMYIYWEDFFNADRVRVVPGWVKDFGLLIPGQEKTPVKKNIWGY